MTVSNNALRTQGPRDDGTKHEVSVAPESRSTDREPRSWWERTKRFGFYQAIRLFRIRARTERIARGFALGLIINFLPTFGLGVFISGFLARLFGGHVVAGFVGGATLTFAWPILFLLNLHVGNFLIGAPPIDLSNGLSDQLMNKLIWGQAFIMGMIFNMIAVGMLIYVVMRMLYRHVRRPVLGLLRRRIRRRPERLRITA
ncbi:MAG: DUF2062 domain-containing protein [Limisphaerales bacterium]